MRKVKIVRSNKLLWTSLAVNAIAVAILVHAEYGPRAIAQVQAPQVKAQATRIVTQVKTLMRKEHGDFVPVSESWAQRAVNHRGARVYECYKL